MSRYVLLLQDIDAAQIERVGGKGAQLGALSRIEGVRVPPGFCVTTDAFLAVLVNTRSISNLVERLSRLAPEDRESIHSLSTEIRRSIEAVPIPEDLAASVTAEVARLGDSAAFAVRSSATAEDLPTASFAGQHDTYLNVMGPEAVLEHVSRCWGSLFSERAVTYRLHNVIDHQKLRMAVVVQQMVFADAAGILFTADPVTGNRRVASIEASFGLGEALVSGLVNADVYKIRDGDVVARTIGTKERAVVPSPAGGVEQRLTDAEQRGRPALTDAQAVELARLGRRIEAQFGRPQDIEWCLAEEEFQIVQSRPITTLFPIPDGDGEHRVYLSVGHQQMMTDAMRPLGLSFWQMTTPRPMAEAGGRLFVDVTPILASPASRAAFVEMSARSDPLTADALQTIIDRDGFIPSLDVAADVPPPGVAARSEPEAPLDADPAIVDELIAEAQASIAASRGMLARTSGSALLDAIEADIPEMRRVLFDRRSHRAFMGAMEASWWLNEHIEAWLGEKNVADTLTRSVPNNVTSQMGLALMAVADVIRPHPALVAFLEQVDTDDFMDELPALPGGGEARDAIAAFLDTYGMRCAGEIDITRPRWSERPSTLVPLILGNVRTFETGEGERRFERGRQQAHEKEQEILERLRTLPDGEAKAEETKRRIDRVRTFIGYREYPKYAMVSRYFVYKQALLDEAERLVRAGVLREPDDVFYLRFDELKNAVRTGHVDRELIEQRRDEFRSDQALTPPRVLTSEGEALNGAYRRGDAPDGALLGLPVSAGVVEGRARVILDMAQADVEAGDILVTAYTDPSWTPLFVAIKGLVTEVGGQMTHGAVVAREYGLPAVVAVDDATRLIRDGQRLRVNGTEGFVEILS